MTTVQENLSVSLTSILRTSITNAQFKPPNAYAASLWRFVGKIIALDGIPCAGKTTLGRALRDHFHENGIPAIFLEEHMNRHHLSAFYNAMNEDINPNPHAFDLQLCAMMECIMLYNEALHYAGRTPCGGKPHVVILDRPIWGNRVFEQLHVAKGNITQEQHSIYDSYIEKHGPYMFDYLIYLYVSPEKALHRLKKVRKNPEEKDVPLAYLKDLELAYYSHLRIHLEQADPALMFIPNDDAYYEVGALLQTLVKHNKPPRIDPQLITIPESPHEVATIFRTLCELYTK